MTRWCPLCTWSLCSPGFHSHRGRTCHWALRGPRASAAACPGHRGVHLRSLQGRHRLQAPWTCRAGRLSHPCHPFSSCRVLCYGHHAITEGQNVPGQGHHVRLHLAAACFYTACESRTGFTYISGRGNPATPVTHEATGSRNWCHEHPFTGTHSALSACRQWIRGHFLWPPGVCPTPGRSSTAFPGPLPINAPPPFSSRARPSCRLLS